MGDAVLGGERDVLEPAGAVEERLGLGDATGAQNLQVLVGDGFAFLQTQRVKTEAHLTVVSRGYDAVDDLQFHRGDEVKGLSHGDLLLDHHTDGGGRHHPENAEGGEAGVCRLLHGFVHGGTARHCCSVFVSWVVRDGSTVRVCGSEVSKCIHK